MEALFIFLLVLAVFAGLIWLGYGLAHDKLADDQVALAQQRQALDVEWQALENGRRVNDVFFQARQAMRQAEQERRSRS
jgi:cell division protein FtsL